MGEAMSMSAGDIGKFGLARKSQLKRDTLFKGLPIVASRGNGFNANNSLSNGTDLQATTRMSHIVAINAVELRLVYANYYQGASNGPNAITVKATLDPPNNGILSSTSSGGAYPVSFNGQQSVTIQPGGYAISDPIPFSVTQGQYLYERTLVSVATSGQKWPTNTYTYPNADEGVVHGSDATGSNVAVPGTNEAAYSSLAIIGTPTGNAVTRSWALVGDSILDGTGDNAHNDLGFAVRACNAANYGYMNVSRPGEQLATFSASGWYTRLAQAVACSHVLEEYSRNDWANGQTLAQMQANKLIAWGLFATRGLPVFTTTSLPGTTSTDGWATLGSQTVTAYESVRLGYNAWVRDGSPILNGVAVAAGSSAPGTLRAGMTGHPLAVSAAAPKGYFEMADTVESSRNSGLWAITGVRSVPDAAINSASATLTSATANFTGADLYKQIQIAGAGASGAALNAYIAGVTNSTTITISGAGASTTVSGATCGIGMQTIDGTHPSTQGHIAMAGALNLTA